MRYAGKWGLVGGLVVAGLMCPAASFAEEASDQQLLARRAVALSVAPGLDGRIDRMAGEAAEKQPADKQAQARADLLKAAAGIREDLLAAFTSYYARSFTPDELKGIVAFYESPLGQKLVRVEEHKPAEVNAAIQQQIMKLVALLNAPPR